MEELEKSKIKMGLEVKVPLGGFRVGFLAKLEDSKEKSGGCPPIRVIHI